ncbi:hypothetical protein B0H65DRAFT_512686 [Neurospora tetraspora]|uniref:Zn(2)-C6 fungal-type domain-containing protein n=1 Tax=Neurospora tetraspora TaxID=94610 RepID=A0AAE0J1C7_9PEZI|nr:hypothetical protein B0H65DRAFT_512686 [Neurospora tetraspora]
MQNFREIRPASIPTHGHDVEGAAQPTLQPRDHAEQQQPHPHILPHAVAPGFVAAGNTGLPIPVQGPQRIESIVLPRRKRSVVQACRDCRKTKAKCGGQRPKCNNCKAKGRQCGYDGEEGQSRYKAMKSRLALLEKTMQQLRKATPEQAVRLIEELKQTPDESFTPMAAMDEDENTPTGTPPTTVMAPAGNTSTNATGRPSLQHASSYNSVDSSQNQTLVGSSTASSSRHNSGQGLQEQEEASPLRDRASVSTEPPILSPTPWQLWDNNNSTAVNPSPGGAFSDGRRQSSPTPAIHLPIPDLETTNAAIKEYFIRIDRLFQPFSRDELKSLHRIASGLDDYPLNSSHIDRKRQQQIALSCLTAVASLGSQCLMDAQTDSRVQEQEAFTNLAKHYLDVVIEHEPLDAVRVCALLAGTVIMNKPGLALSYVAYRMNHDAAQKQAQLLEAQQAQRRQALAAARHGGLLASHGQGMMSPTTSLQAQLALSPVPHKGTIGHGRSWRTLVFLASWLSSAHGYIIGSDLLVERQLSPEAEPPYPENADLVEITEIALTRLCYIKSSILRLRASNLDLTPHSIRHVLLSLRHWYHTLPSTIQLNFHNISRSSPSGSPFPSASSGGASSGTTSGLLETHRSIHHIHILYSDSITLLYRWLISQSITCRLHGNHEGHHALDTPLRELLLEHADDAIRVAGLSAVVLRRMIHNDEEILMPCWTAGFQAYTSCAVLLWSVVGKMVNGVGVHAPRGGVKEAKEWEWQDRYGWRGELDRVHDCLVVLELCARLGGGRDGAERWWRRMRALLSVVESSATYRQWGQQQQLLQQQQRERELAYHQNPHGSPDHGNRQQQQQQQQQRPPPLALEPQDRSYLLTLPPPHAHATNGKVVDYSLARVSVSLIMLLHQSFGAPGSQKLEGVGDEEFAVGDWGQHIHSRRGSAVAGAAVPEDGNTSSGANLNGLLDLESEQARILEWLGWNLPVSGLNGGMPTNVPVPVDPGMAQGDRHGSGGGGGYQQGSMGMGMMRMDLGR